MSTEDITMETSDESDSEKLKSSPQKTASEKESIGIINETDREVKDEQHDDFKTKIEILVQLGKDELRSFSLSDCYASDRPGMHLEILPKVIFESIDDETSLEEIDVPKPVLRQTVDQGTQASVEFKSSKAQTLRRRLVNSWSQYEPRLFTEEEIQNHLSQTSFQTFNDNTEKSILESLVQNSIADTFFWDLTSLYNEEVPFQGEEESLVISGSFSCTESSESNRMISSIGWNPLHKDIFVASTISSSTLETRTGGLLQLKNDSILFFMWSARNHLFPKLFLEYFDDLSIVKFNPLKPNLLASGSLIGQLVLWDIKLEMYIKDDDELTSMAGFTTPPLIRCVAVSSMDHIHKYGITDLQWVPPNVEIASKGEILKNTASGYQIVTCGFDGILQFWDLRMGLQHKPGNPIPKKFNQLDGIWEPFHSIEVLPREGKKRKSLTRFILRSSSEPISEEHANVNGGELLESEYYAGCDDGQILCGSFKLTRDDAGKFMSKPPEFFDSPLGGAVTVLASSPFMRDVILSAGGKTIAVWQHAIKSEPVYLREGQAYITCGQWSPTRPALFILGFEDGSIEVWDLLRSLYHPSVKRFMSTSAIKSVSIHSMTEHEHVIAAGDSKGVVYTMNLLPSFWTVLEDELEKMRQLIETEANRIRENQMGVSGDVQEVSEKIAAKETTKKSEVDMKAETPEEVVIAQNYEEFLRLEEKELKDLGLWKEEDVTIDKEEVS